MMRAMIIVTVTEVPILTIAILVLAVITVGDPVLLVGTQATEVALVEFLLVQIMAGQKMEVGELKIGMIHRLVILGIPMEIIRET